MPRVKSTHVDHPAAFGQRLREARRAAGLSQRGLAFDGCSPAYISRLESGDRIASLQLVRELARRLGVSEDYLARGSAGSRPELADAEMALRLDEPERAGELFRKVLAESDELEERALALEGLGQLAFRAGRPEEAIELFGEALAAAGVEPPARPAVAESLARAHASMGDLAAAIELLEQCVERYRDDPLQYVRFASFLGYALTDNGNFADAERVVSKALSIGREIADPYARARLYWSEFRVRAEQGQSAQAEPYARKALETLRTTEDDYAVGHLHQALAQICLDLERPGEALDLLREGWPLFEAAATPLERAQYRIDEARTLAALGEHAEAAGLAMEASGQLDGRHRTDAGRAYAVLGEVFAQTGDAARAKELLELAISILEDRPPSRYLVKAYKQLAALLEDDGREAEGFELLKRAVDVQLKSGRALV